MSSLSRENRKLLENKVAAARQSAVPGARKALIALRVGDKESPRDPDQKAIRYQLRAHGRQLGDARQSDGTQETRRLEQACAYEHWHRMLFARFLAENDLLVNPDYGVAMSLAEIQETAREQGHDWISLASEYAQRMLLEVFRPDDPVLRVALPPETRQELEHLLGELPSEIFTADDSLGWVYQFWQRDEKKRVNSLEIPIGAEEIAPVTQLFTEDYMVLFLLHNTLGAWWASKRRAEGKSHQLPDYRWTYLRLNEDGSPLAGNFDGWPRTARELRILDPCMGSGHFLTFALPILALMRKEEEGLSLAEAVHVALAENLFGLELDARCSQIAAFNLALTAWRMIGLPTSLPSLNLACSGLGIHAKEAEWIALVETSGRQQDLMGWLYSLFRQAPTLGSLIDPLPANAPMVADEIEDLRPVLERALTKEGPSEEGHELAIAASGLLEAARILSNRYSLIATNVPFLLRRKQSKELLVYGDANPESKPDLATLMIKRCLRLLAPGGAMGIVTPQNWLYLSTYEHFRRILLSRLSWTSISWLGSGAFGEITGEVVKPALLTLIDGCDPASSKINVIDASKAETVSDKADILRLGIPSVLIQSALLAGAQARVTPDGPSEGVLLESVVQSINGMTTGDLLRLSANFWEVPSVGDGRWIFLQTTPEESIPFSGCNGILRWEKEKGFPEKLPGSFIRGLSAWGRRGIIVKQTGVLKASLYSGEAFEVSSSVLIPTRDEVLPAVWAYVSSPRYNEDVRSIDSSLKVTNATLAKVEFDIAYWGDVATATLQGQVPRPFSGDATQWQFDGNPRSAERPLQVAVARLAGYRWPRQTGSSFLDCPALESDGLESHADAEGIVCINSLSGELAAAERLRSLLADAYGTQWSASKLAELVGDAGTVDVWLRDRFFEQHCALFHSRPFIWHIWDGRKDGFHAIVNYHQLAGPNGEGRKTLEKLIYKWLGDWISRQQAEVASGADGAEGRLTAAKHLRSELTNILNGEPPYDLFIRWKPLHDQPIGWEPDLNDGVRLNMRPWLNAKPYQEPNQKLKQGACILRVTPIKLPLGKDRGKEPFRDKRDFPWLATSEDRTNDEHFTLEQKRVARERKQRT